MIIKIITIIMRIQEQYRWVKKESESKIRPRDLAYTGWCRILRFSLLFLEGKFSSMMELPSRRTCSSFGVLEFSSVFVLRDPVRIAI